MPGKTDLLRFLVGCPVIIGDGLKGTDDIEIPVKGGEYVKAAKIGRAVMDADIFISLTHFKGHEMTGFGGTIKNIGMAAVPVPEKPSSTAAENHISRNVSAAVADAARRNVPTAAWSSMKQPEKCT